MREAYDELLEPLAGGVDPFHTYTLQYSLIFYLVLGQLAALVAWRAVVRGQPASSYRQRIAFTAYLLGVQVVLFAAWPSLIGWWRQTDVMLLADIVVVLHFLLIVAVPIGLLLVLVGGWRGWEWIRNFWLRLVHLLVIEVVAGQAIVGIECPLKTLERHLRGGPEQLHNVEGSSAIGIWCNEMVYHQGEAWVFLVAYASVGLLVLSSWALLPPRFPWRERNEPHMMDSGKEKTLSNGVALVDCQASSSTRKG